MKTDVHTHLIPRILGPAAEVAGLRVDEDGYIWNGQQKIGFRRLYDSGELEEWLRKAGLDRALVSVPPPIYRQGMAQQNAEVWVRAINDALEEGLKESNRLIPLGYLPLDHPELALAEAERLAAKGAAGFCGSAGGGSVPLDSESLRPLWEFLNEQQHPIILHPGTSPDPRMDEHYLNNLLGNPVETGLAAAQLLLGGVIVNFPDLRVCLVHCGGVTASVVARWQKGVATARPGIKRHDADVVAEAKRFWVDTLSHDKTLVKLAIETFGEHHILVGSDWPFPMGDDDPLSSIAHLGEASVQKIAVDNPRSLLQRPERRA